MKVTALVEITKAKYKVFIDGEFAFVLYRGELRQLKVALNQDLDETTYNTIITEIIPKRAKLRAMHLLEKRPYTEYGMRTKLKENSYSDEIIDLVIDYLKGYKYIDDVAYATLYFETYSSAKSVKRMELDLRNKGVKSDAIDKAREHCAELGELPDEHRMIRELIKKKGFPKDDATQKDIAKLANYLMGKGFSYDAVNYELRHYIED